MILDLILIFFLISSILLFVILKAYIINSLEFIRKTDIKLIIGYEKATNESWKENQVLVQYVNSILEWFKSMKRILTIDLFINLITLLSLASLGLNVYIILSLGVFCFVLFSFTNLILNKTSRDFTEFINF